MLKSLNLRDYILPNPVKVKPGDNVMDAMRTIIDNKISGVCVVDGDGNLVGVLSEMDCLRGVLAATYNNTGIGLVQEHMTKENLLVAHPEENMLDVAQDMLLKGNRRRPVLENGRLIGQITCRQLLSAVKQFR
jgi:CBS domain-containing protein